MIGTFLETETQTSGIFKMSKRETFCYITSSTVVSIIGTIIGHPLDTVIVSCVFGNDAEKNMEADFSCVGQDSE